MIRQIQVSLVSLGQVGQLGSGHGRLIQVRSGRSGLVRSDQMNDFKSRRSGQVRSIRSGQAGQFRLDNQDQVRSFYVTSGVLRLIRLG